MQNLKLKGTIPENIFKSYDIRGIYPDEINEENIYQITQAIYKFLVENHFKDKPLKIVTGRDMRLSGPSLYPILQKALSDAGAEVIDIGLVSTPTFYFAVYQYGYDGGVQLSASHNPPQYNGMKIVKNSPYGLIKIGKSTGMEMVKKYALQDAKIQRVKDAKRGNLIHKKGVLEEEIENAKKLMETKDIKRLRVVADAANAMGATYIEALFEELPCELIKMNFKLDGSFPAHQPDPLVKKNLKDLQKRVLQEKADLGLAPDGDGDRLFFIDEKANIIPASLITALVAKELLKKHQRATILYDIRYTLTPKKVIEENGGQSVITKVGHAFITEAMAKNQAIFAGESSGHYFFAQTGNAESQLPVILTVLEVISRKNKPLSKIIEELQRGFESGEYNFKTTNSAQIFDQLKKKYADGKLSTLDGVAVEYDNWRFGVRASNTEPLLRLNVEADLKGVMEQRRDELIKFIKSFGAIPQYD